MRSLSAIAMVGLLVGCAPGRARIEGDAVRHIRFRGNGSLFSGHNDLQLRVAMTQEASPNFAFTFPFDRFVTPASLDLDVLAQDAQRIEIWYAHHGWFDAEFQGWTVRRIREEGRPDRRLRGFAFPTDDYVGLDLDVAEGLTRLAGVVDLVGTVDPGEPSMVRDIGWEGLEGTGAIGRLLLSIMDRSVGVSTGAAFNLDLANAGASAAQSALRNRSYAYATVEVRMDAYPEEHAVDLTYAVDLGPRVNFDGVEVRGAKAVPVERVIQVVERNGDPHGPYNADKLTEIQQALFNTGLFSLVSVGIDRSDKRPETVPMVVEVVEAKPRRLRLGGGVEYDLFTLVPTISAEFQDTNLGGSLVKLDTSASVGALVGVVREDDASSFLPTGAAELTVSYPWALRRKLALEASGGFTQDAQFGSIPYRELEAGFDIAYRPDRKVSFGVGPTFQYFEYLNLDAAALNAARVQFGGDFGSATYQLLSIDFSYVGDWRDDPLRTRRGSLWRLDVRQSLPIPRFQLGSSEGSGGKGFLYTKISGEVRGYRPFGLNRKTGRLPWVIMGRAHGVALLPWDPLFANGWDGGLLPYVDLGFLGGPSSLRGFRTNQVGPYDCVCTYDDGVPSPPHNNGEDADVDRTYLPRGGTLALQAMTELRYDTTFDVSLAAFADVGLLTRTYDGLGPEDIRYGGGVGLRYDSVIGPLRFDLGFRPLFEEDYGPTNTFGCAPADRLPRAFDLMSASRNVRSDVADRHPPFALNLFFAIGQAF